ncbi:unnamed protein product [Candidula unifasciata]|uniref:Uncharacterized protein n=1 Tax=Candidula unifasciata TaxID=100452 RepID=A0A8S3YCA2_9EUPU|nr:unnamed protein product [Candidula unifasciata]
MAKFCESTKKLKLTQESSPDKTPSPQYLSVDETKRPRANSDPVGLHLHINPVPEITVTGEDCRDGGRTEDDEEDSFLIPPFPRRRANTCPEDMFRVSRGRPPTPPPTDLRILRNSAGKRFSFNFSPKDISSISFAHHKLSKVSEEKQEQQPKLHSEQECVPLVSTPSTSCSCSSEISGKNPEPADPVSCRLHSSVNYSEAHAEHSSDQRVITQMSGLSVAESVADTTNKKKTFTETTLNADVLTNSQDSWKSKDNSRDSSDSQRLKAY